MIHHPGTSKAGLTTIAHETSRPNKAKEAVLRYGYLCSQTRWQCRRILEYPLVGRRILWTLSSLNCRGFCRMRRMKKLHKIGWWSPHDTHICFLYLFKSAFRPHAAILGRVRGVRREFVASASRPGRGKYPHAPPSESVDATPCTSRPPPRRSSLARPSRGTGRGQSHWVRQTVASELQTTRSRPVRLAW
jgi:hypothetical protein